MNTLISSGFRQGNAILTLWTILFLAIAPALSATENHGMTDKITFRVDTRNITVAPTGMFIAGSFFSTIGYTNWTFIPMCDLGSGIWEISFANVPPGTYQYKFVNGNAPADWEFDSFGGPCTNPLDNNNRWLNYPGGMHFEGPHCFNTCDIFCPGFGDPGVSDITPPTIDEPAPANVTVNCGSTLPSASPLAASDGCDANATTSTGPPVDDLGGLNACGLGNIVRTWTATDCAGNTSSVSQTITVIDNEPPVFTGPLPPDTIFLDCSENIPASFQLPISDACDPSALFSNVITDGGGLDPACGTGTVLRTWTGTDCAGNSVSTSQVMVFEDQTPPVFTGPIPPDVTVECQNLPAANPIPASDNCSSAITSSGPPTDDLSGLGPCGTGLLVRSWSVTDCAGHTISASQNITLTDNTPPTITGAPTDVTVICGNIPAAAPLGASDFCDATVTATTFPTDDLSGIGLCGTGQIIRTWEVSDCSGNLATVSQTITVADNLPPVILGGVPPNTTLDCNNPLPPALPLPAADDCDASVTSTGLPTDNLGGINSCGTGQIVRTWTVSDCSGNSTSVSQTITVTDLGSPFITEPIPADVTVTCGSLPPPVLLQAADACDQNTVFTAMPVDDLSGLGACGSGIVIRTWTATDCSGNSISSSQTITVADLNPPVITGTVPANTVVQCGNLPPAAPLAASDDCDASLAETGMPVDDLSALDACGLGDVVRTWTATDCGGNTATASQIITLEDATPPVLTIPNDTTYDCGNVPPAAAGDASATDNCGTPTVVFEGEMTVGNGCPYELHRTWTTTDCAGNTVSLTQIITVEDTEWPVFTNPPADITVCAGDVPAMTDLAWTDNCDGAGSVNGTDVSDGMTDPETISRTWTYTDACGNAANFTQTITVEQPPVADAGADQTVCGSTPVSLSGSVAGGFSSVLWTSSGDGIFDDETTPNATYTPGTGDVANGSVSLVFIAGTTAGACSQATDSLTVSFTAGPTADAGLDQTLNCATTSVTLDGSGSSSGPGIQYAWSGPGIGAGNANEQSPAVALPGVYTLTVSEGPGGDCEATSTVTVFENTDPPTADAGADLTLTCTQTSVTLDGSASTGSTSLEFEWAGPGITAAVANLPNPTVSEPGVYTLTVTDPANGCTASDQAEVMPDSDLPVADAGDDQTIDCNTASVTLGGANSSAGPGIGYQWTAPDGTLLGAATTQIATQGGAYVFTVSDAANGCSISATVEVEMDTVAPVADAGADVTLTCSLTSAALGGNSSQGANFSYAWTTGGNPAGSNDSLTATLPGVYVLTVLNAENGCTASDEATVFENTTVPTASAGPDLTLDCATAAVTLDGSGSSAGPNFTYQWSGPGFTSVLNSPQVSAAGTYVLTVTDTGNACTATDTVTVTADAGLPTADAGPDTVLTCAVDEILLEGGNSSQGPDFSYAWSDAGGNLLGNSLPLTVSGPGIFTLTVSNTANGCMAFDEILVEMDTVAPIANAGPDQEFTCSQTTATLDGSGSSAGSGFAYLWTGPGLSGDPASLSVEVVETGTYTLTVSNLANGCTAADEAVVSQNADVPTADAGPDLAITCVLTSVNLQGNASVPNAAFEWSGPGIGAGNATLPNPTVSEPGTYSLVVTDPATGCESPAALVEVMADTAAPVAVIQPPGGLDCQTDFVELDGSASTPPTVAFEWISPFGGGTNPTHFANGAWVYTLIVTDVNGCTGSASVEVLDNSNPPVVTIAGDDLLTCLEDTLQLSETTASGLPGITLAWATVGGNFTQNQAGLPTVELDAAGLYIVTATDTLTGCSASDSLLVAADFETPVITFDQNFEIGCMASGVMLGASVTGGSGSFAYAWSGPGFTSDSPTPTVSLPGNYELTATMLSNGCTATGSTEVEQISGIADIIFTVTSPRCPGDADGILQIDSVAGFNPPYRFSVNGGAFSAASIFENLVSGSYTLTVQDGEGCEFEANFSIDDPAGVFVDLGDDLEIRLGDSVRLSPVFSPLAEIFSWSNAGFLSCGDCPEPYAHPLATTVFSLTVTDANGCQATDELTIVVDPRLQVYAPNAFSPNGDGINDYFTIFAGSQVTRIRELQVFDRWGAQVFKTGDIAPGEPSAGWDGRHRGRESGAGVYVFWAELLLADGSVRLLEGEVILIK